MNFKIHSYTTMNNRHIVIVGAILFSDGQSTWTRETWKVSE